MVRTACALLVGAVAVGAFAPPGVRRAAPSAARVVMAGGGRRALLGQAAAAAAALLLAPAARAADQFDVNVDGKVVSMTELEARDALTKKVEAATQAGKGLDVEKRGQFNEKALFSEDFYFKYGLRPTPEDAAAKMADVIGNEQMPFAPIQRRYAGYNKYNERVRRGLDTYGGELRDAVSGRKWAEVGPLLEKGYKGKGSNANGEGTGKAASELRSACRAYGLFANTVLQSENDNGATLVNLLARHLINELYFSLDDLAAAAEAGDARGAEAAWKRGKEYTNAYLKIVNVPISAKVGDRFGAIETSL